MISIVVAERTLSDGSHVYDVGIWNKHREGITLPAITLTDACQLADKFAAALKQHTNEEHEVRLVTAA